MAIQNTINLTDTGIVSADGNGIYTGRSIVPPAAGMTVTNANGVAGNPTLALADDLFALEGLTSTGVAVRTAASTWTERTITAGNGITITNGDGVAGNPTASMNSMWMMQGNNCWFWNLSFTHSGGTLTLAGADGTALSATNKGYVAMRSNATAGRIIVHEITANDTLTVSDLTGNLFGTTAAIAWGNDMPLYVGFMADSNDANLEPIICRLPNLEQAPAASTDIGDPSSATADKELSVFAWNDITEANYTDKTVGMIGSIRATKAVTTDAWTLVAMDVLDGAGAWQEDRVFSFPVGQNGAAAGKHMADNGGTAAQFNNITGYQYTIRKDGYVSARWSSEPCTVAGIGAVDVLISFPYGGNSQYRTVGATRFLDNSGSTTFIGFNEWEASGANRLLNLFIGTSLDSPLQLTAVDLNDAIIVSATCVLSQTHVT